LLFLEKNTLDSCPQARMTFQIILLEQFYYAKHDPQIYVYMIKENGSEGNRFLKDFAL